jgi:hypothetical protein
VISYLNKLLFGKLWWQNLGDVAIKTGVKQMLLPIAGCHKISFQAYV